MGLINFTKKELILKIEELNKLISDKKEITEGSSDVSKNKNAIYYLLKESESKLKEVQEIAHIGHWNLDIINNQLDWSDEIYKIFRQDPTKFEATYENLLSTVHPDDREFVNKSYTESVENKTKYNITHRIVLPKGEIRFVRERCKTTYDGSGRPIYSLGTIQDITEVKLATEELLRSEKRFKQLFEELGDAVYVTKIGGANKGLILEVNSAATQQTGYTKKELLKMNIINDISILGSGEITTDEWEELLHKGKSVTTTEMKRRKDGTEFWTEVIVTTIDFNGERASLSINRDITKQKQAEEALYKSESNLIEAQRLAHVGSWEWDIKTDNVTWSRELFNLLGRDYNMPAPTYAELAKIYTQNSFKRLNIAVEECLKTGTPYELELDMIKDDGIIIHLLANGKRDTDESGKVIGLRGTVQDINERKITELKLKESQNNYDRLMVSAIQGFMRLKFKKPLKIDIPIEEQILWTIDNLFVAECNNIFANMYGFKSSEDIIGKSVVNIWDGEENARRIIENYLSCGYHWVNLETREVTSAGNEKFFLNNCISIYNNDNEIVEMWGSQVEITERKKSEEEIRKLNKELEKKVIKGTEKLMQEKNFSNIIINSLPGIFSLIGKDGSHVRWNLNHEKVTGFSTKEYKQMQALDFFDKSEKGKILSIMSQIFEKGKGHIELNLLTKRGKLIPYFFTGRRIDINNKKYVAGMAIDITKRKNTEKKLLKKTEDLEAFNNVMLEREIRIIEMKEEVNKLSEQIGLEPPYPPVWKNGGQSNEER